MPTYSYACTECDNRFDIVQSFTDDTLTVCPACSGKLRKLFNSVGIVFKGTGFYRTDSRGGSTGSDKVETKADGAKSDGATKSDSAAKTESTTKSDTKATTSSSSPAATAKAS